MNKKGFWAPDTKMYYEHIKAGAKNHIEVPIAPINRADYVIDFTDEENPIWVYSDASKERDIKNTLDRIDLSAVRSIREYIVASEASDETAMNEALAFLINKNTEAIEERNKL